MKPLQAALASLVLLGHPSHAAAPQSDAMFSMTDCQGTTWKVRLVPPSSRPPEYALEHPPQRDDELCYARPAAERLAIYGWVADAPGAWTAWWVPAPGEEPEAAARRHLALCQFEGLVVDHPEGGFGMEIRDARFGGVSWACSAGMVGLQRSPLAN